MDNFASDMTRRLVDSVRLNVLETEEEFIFDTINGYIGTISEIKVSKEELVRAVSYIRMQREAVTLYGACISPDYTTATSQINDLREAYNRGVHDGIEKCKMDIKSQLFGE